MESTKPIIVQVFESNPTHDSELTNSLSHYNRIQLRTNSGLDTEQLPLADETAADIVLIDLDTVRSKGVQICNHFKQLPNPPPVLFLTDRDNSNLAHDLFKAGANGCLPKATRLDVLVSAIDCIVHGSTVWMPSMMKLIANFPVMNRKSFLSKCQELTYIESQISALVAAGKTNKEIAKILGKAEKTVRNQLSKLMMKLRITRRSQLASLYSQKAL